MSIPHEMEALFEEFLEQLDDEPGYWDGVYASEKAIATKYYSEFRKWMREKEDT